MVKKISVLFLEYKNGNELVRNKIIAMLAMWCNYVLAVGKFIIGIFSLSFFIVASGFYSTGMGLSRSIYLNGYNKKNDEIKYYIMIAIALIISGILYGMYMVRFIVTDYVLNLGPIIPIGIAAVSFTELVLSIIGMLKARKHDNILYKAISNVNLLTALAAIALTQISILHSKNENPVNTNVYNGIFGLAIAGISILIGVVMIINGVKFIKNFKSKL